MKHRKHLTRDEVNKLIAATKGATNEARDRCLLLLIYCHGLRVSETRALTLSSVDVQNRIIHITRSRKGLSTTHPLRQREIRAINAWLIERAKKNPQIDAFFLNDPAHPIHTHLIFEVIEKYSKRAGLSFRPNPDMLRHACGFALAEQGADKQLIRDYLGYRSSRYATKYTAPRTPPRRISPAK